MSDAQSKLNLSHNKQIAQLQAEVIALRYVVGVLSKLIENPALAVEKKNAAVQQWKAKVGGSPGALDTASVAAALIENLLGTQVPSGSPTDPPG